MQGESMTHLAQDAESGRRDEGGEPFADPQGRQSAVPSGGHRISARGSRGSRGARAINAQELLERDERAAKPSGFSRGCKQRTYVRGGIPCTSGRRSRFPLPIGGNRNRRQRSRIDPGRAGEQPRTEPGGSRGLKQAAASRELARGFRGLRCRLRGRLSQVPRLIGVLSGLERKGGSRRGRRW